MSRNRWLERPWLIALGTLAVALLPVVFGFLNFRTETERNDRELLETTTRLALQSLRLSTVRHLNLLVNFRAQLHAAADPANPDSLNSFRQREWQTHFPNWQAIAYAENVNGQAKVRWCEELGSPTGVSIGQNLDQEPRLEDSFVQARQRPFQQFAAEWDRHHLAIIGPVLDSKRSRMRGFLIGWLDLDGMCHDPQLPLVNEGALTLTPISEKTAVPPEETKLRIEESGVVWYVAASRGPRFATVFARPTPWLVLGGGTFCALLLATLAWVAASSRQQSLRAAELNAALESERELGRLRSHFVNSVSHEFRTPLSVILSSADLLEMYSGQLTPERRQEALAQIQESTRQMTQMVEEVLLLGRIESQGVVCKPVPLEIAAFCHQLGAEALQANHKHISIEIDVPSSLESVPLDSTLLRSILGNLLANAVKYSSSGTTVHLTATASEKTIIFTVQDEGIGIPVADLPRLGGPFYRGGNVGDIPGTGLGMAIIQRCTALHGGDIQLKSMEGQGTTAIVTIPYVVFDQQEILPPS